MAATDMYVSQQHEQQQQPVNIRESITPSWRAAMPFSYTRVRWADVHVRR